MATVSYLVPRVASLLGFSGELSNSTAPTKAQVTTWLADGQNDLVARLVPDAVPQLLVTKQFTGGTDLLLAPGTKVVRVETSEGYVARHVSPHEFIHDPSSSPGIADKKTTGLFAPSTQDPIWTILPTVNNDAGIQVQISDGKTSVTTGFITFTQPIELFDDVESPLTDPALKLQSHLYPLIVRYAYYHAKLADEDEVAAQIIWQDYIRAIEEINALNGGRHFTLGKPDGIA